MRFWSIWLGAIALAAVGGAARGAPAAKPRAPKTRPAPVKPAVPRIPLRTPAPPAVSDPADEERIKQRSEDLESRINAHDIRGVRSFFHPDIRVRGTRGTVQRYRGMVLSMAQTFNKYPKFKTRTKLEYIRVNGEAAAGTMRYENRGLGKKKVEGRCSVVWKRTNGQWLLARMDG